MKTPLGTNGRHLPRYRPNQNNHQAVDDAVGPDMEPVTRTTGTAPGDTRKLRGIPCIGYGVAGAINGTAPHNLRL
jgi:hypothetical protein